MADPLEPSVLDNWTDLDVFTEPLREQLDELYASILGEDCFCVVNVCIPQVDFTADEFLVNFNEDPALFNKDLSVTVQDLTNDENTGVFDVVMEKIQKLLVKEYDSNRISGAEYSKTMAVLIESALSNSVQFTLSKDQSMWEAQKARMDAFSSRVNYEKIKMDTVASQLQGMNLQATYAQNKFKLLTDFEAYGNAKFNNEVLLPAQVGSILAQEELYKGQLAAYTRDSELKAVKVFTDAWTVMHTVSETAPPTGFSTPNLDVLLNTVRVNNGLGPSI